jgi:hypothetical protein
MISGLRADKTDGVVVTPDTEASLASGLSNLALRLVGATGFEPVTSAV